MENFEVIKKITESTDFQDSLYLVGGAVRDKLLDRQATDLDFIVVTHGDSVELANFLKQKLPYEFRIDFLSEKWGFASATLNNQKVDFCRLPYFGASQDVYQRLKSYALQRDFTINSLYLELSTGKILDFSLNGIDDIKGKTIRCVGDPFDRISEDPIRIFRAVRLACELNFTIDPSTFYALKELSPYVNDISKYRLGLEIKKLLCVSKPKKAFKLLSEINVLKHILPELESLKNITQGKQHNEDVFNHTLSVLEKCEPHPILRMAALFHDIGKALTKKESNGKISFIGHEEVSAEIAYDKATEWNLDHQEALRVSELVLCHMKLKQAGDSGKNIKNATLRKLVSRFSVDFNLLLSLIHADNLSQSPEYCMPNQIPAIKERVNELRNSITKKKVNLPLSAHDLILLGLKGPQIGKALNVIQSATEKNPELTKTEAIILINKDQ